MCREVPRWGIRLRPAPKRGPDQPFTWSMFWFNGEQGRAAPHLVLLGVFWAFWGWGNPFAAWPTLAVALIGAAVATYYIVHDIRPRDVSRLSAGWLVAAVMIALVGSGLILTAPVWSVWPQPWHWLGQVGGLALAAVLVVLALRPAQEDRPARVPFGIVMVGWYLLLLALGLLSATYGGVILALVASLTVWALRIAGVVDIPALPRGRGSAAGVALLAGVAFALSVVCM